MELELDLKHCPKSVGADFWSENNRLTSLECPPITVGGSFCCNDNELSDLGNLHCKVGGYFNCENNKITDPLSEIIDNDIVARDYRISDEVRITFEEIEAEKQRRANIKRQLGPFAIPSPNSRL